MIRNLISMGSYMIWKIVFKDKGSKKAFESKMDNKCIWCKEMHDHYHGEISEDYGDFIYDMGYLGYAEAREMKSELKKLGVLKLNEVCICDIDGDAIITHKN